MRKNSPDDVWKFIIKRSPKDCWVYCGSTFSGRYGRFFLNGQAILAHRLVYALSFGAIKNGMFVMHKCNNKLCCNPGHLDVGDNSKNQLHASYSGAFKPGSTEILGVGFDKKRGYWTAQGWGKGKRINLYTGPFLEKAKAARTAWENENHVFY